MIRTVIVCVRCYGSVIRSWTVSVGMGFNFRGRRHRQLDKRRWTRPPSGDAVMALSGYQVAETQSYLAEIALGATLRSMKTATRYPVVACPLIWVKCGRYDCPESPDWDSEMDVCSVEEVDRTNVMDHFRQVMESAHGIR